jgi:hypothetical protein
MPRILALLICVCLVLTACAGSGDEPVEAQPDAAALSLPTVVPSGGQATGAHPRPWLMAADLPRLRSWATDSNPLYRDGLALLAARAVQEMDDGRVPGDDCGNVGYEEYPTESCAELFAFLSLVDNDPAARVDYAHRARSLLMHVMNEAAKGPASRESVTCNGSRHYPPFRHPGFAFAWGDAMPLYNASNEGASAVTQAERAVVWLKPDHIVIYDQAATRDAGKFKRWWLQLPRPARIDGQQATMSTARGQQLFITTLLPADARLTAVNSDEPLIAETAAADDPMTARLWVDGGDAAAVAFLHVLQGADAGASADAVTLVQDQDGAVRGAVIGARAVLFVRAPAGSALRYTLSAAVSQQVVTGLAPHTSYAVQRAVSGDSATIVIEPGGDLATDEGGVLVISP